MIFNRIIIISITIILIVIFVLFCYDPFSTRIPIGPFCINGWHFVVMNPSISTNKNHHYYECIARLDNCVISSNERITDITSHCSPKIIETTKRLSSYRNTRNHMLNLIIVFQIGNEKEFKILDNFTSTIVNNHCGLEDPRFFQFQSDCWVYVNGRMQNNWTCNPAIFQMSDPKNVIQLTYGKAQSMEKNWMPFEYNNELYFEYKIQPHVILRCDTKTGQCTEVYRTEHNIVFIMEEIGGGAPPQLFYRQKTKSFSFLGLAHIRSNNPYIFRKSFFYIFECRPPFQVLWIGDTVDFEFPVVPIEYATGLLVDDKNQKIIVSYGRNDASSHLIEIDIEQLETRPRKI